MLYICDVDSISNYEKEIKNIIGLNNMYSIIILLIIVFFLGIVVFVIEEIIFRGLIF